jgi:drug/metabolite transporter (DMT)-like permease
LASEAALPAPRRVLRTGFVLAMLGAIGFSGKAIIVKLAYRHGVDAVTLIMLRMVFALPLFVAMAWWAGRGKPRLAGRDRLAVAGLGFSGYYLSSMLDFMGLQYISASLERLILYLTPTLVLVLGWALHGRRISWRHALGMAISYAGVVVVFGQELSLQGSRVGWGALLVVISTVSYAVYLVFGAEVVQRLGSLRLVGQASIVACLCCIVHFLLARPVASVASLAPQVIGLSVFNAVLCTALPILMVMMAVERIGAGLASQIGMIGPMMTIFMGVWLLGEPFTASVALGTALVFSGIFVVTRSRQSPAQ